MKHITEAVRRVTSYKLDKELKRATVKTVRNKIRKLTSIWQRKTNLTIPPEVHDSVAPVSVHAAPTMNFNLYMFTNEEKVYQRRAQIHDSPVDRRKGTHVFNDRELHRHGGVLSFKGKELNCYRRE